MELKFPEAGFDDQMLGSGDNLGKTPGTLFASACT